MFPSDMGNDKSGPVRWTGPLLLVLCVLDELFLRRRIPGWCVAFQATTSVAGVSLAGGYRRG